MFFKFRDPYISQKKKSSDYGVYGIHDRLERTHAFNAKIGFEKYAPGYEILSKTPKHIGMSEGLSLKKT